MNCKRCNTPLADDEIICPSCGEDNARPKRPDWKVIVAVVCCIALVVGFAATWLVMNRFPEKQTEKISDKESYSVSDFEAKAKADVVVAKIGDSTLTNAELQVIYWSMVYDFMDSYGEYAYYLLDINKPLDEQYYSEASGITWQYYFLTLALQNWQRYEVLSAEANKAGMELAAEYQASLDGMYASMEEALKDVKLDTVEEIVNHDYGAGATFDAYKNYTELYYRGNQYFNQLISEITITDDQVEAFYAENEEDFVSSGCSKDDGNAVDVRHVLIRPNDKQNTTSYTDEEWAACLEKAQGLLDQWVAEGATEEGFIQLAKDHSADGNASTGGLYSGITSETNFVKPYLDWCMDETRQIGDYGLVKTDYGYHIMYFVDSYPLWYEVAFSNVLGEQAYDEVEALEQEYTMIVAYSRIALGVVDMGI